jgi:hypothetical protein
MNARRVGEVSPVVMQMRCPVNRRQQIRAFRPKVEEGAVVRKRTVTTIEIAELLVVSTARTDIPRPPCPICAGPMMLTPEEAAGLARVTVRTIYARVEAGSVHFLEKPDGLLLLCANSLSQREQPEALKRLICATNSEAETPMDKE